MLLRTLGALLLALGLAATPAVGQKPGGTLQIYNTSNPPSASPHEDTTIAVVMPFMAIYNNLVRYDPIKPRNSFDTIIPELATSWGWDATKTKLTFELRSDVKWHDGKPFTGKDVQCTFHRLNGKEPDYLRRNPRGIWYEHLTEVTLNGDYEVTFNLSQPQPSLLAMLASGYTAVYPCHVSGRDMRIKPIGTGPFKFVEFKSNESIRLVKKCRLLEEGPALPRRYRVAHSAESVDAHPRFRSRGVRPDSDGRHNAAAGRRPEEECARCPCAPCCPPT